MEHFFGNLLNASFHGSIVILAVIVGVLVGAVVSPMLSLYTGLENL